MVFQRPVKDQALIACGRHCCLCHKFCGLKIEIHHIKPEASGGPNTFENAIPLCFDCHADMRTYDAKHPKGTKYSESELKSFRNNWYSRIANTIDVISTNSIDTDKEIYKTLLTVLPWNGSLSFINETNFAGFSFETASLNQLTEFQYLCKNPSFEFIDTDLEGMRSDLLNSIKKFQFLIGVNTFPTMSIGSNHVPPEWEVEDPERFNKIVNDIHESVELILSTYKQLTRLGARKLGIVPALA